MAIPIRTLLVDHESTALTRLIALLREHGDINIVGIATTGDEALSAIEATRPDLAFLEVELPGLHGIELARNLTPAGPAIVFVTNRHHYAVHAFEVRALDYLMKPLTAERLATAVGHARRLLATPRRAEPRRRLLVKSNRRMHLVRANDIDWCEAEGNYVRLYVGAQTHLLRATLNELQAQLDSRQFLRVHRSNIVNIDRILELQASDNGEYTILLRDQTRLTLSRGYRDVVHRALGEAI